MSQPLKPRTHPIWEKYDSAEKLPNSSYWEIHKNFLNPTGIKIDTEAFLDEISHFDEQFSPWGNNRPEQRDIRKGLPLVNLDGVISREDDISIGPLDHYNSLSPNHCKLEVDFAIPTTILNLRSLDPLTPLKNYMCRSSILKWEKGANFKPHWDVVLPTVNLRLWGTTSAKTIDFCFENHKGDMEKLENIQNGRLYLIDTSKVHKVDCLSGTNYQFFISLNVASFSAVRGLLE